MSRWVKVTQVVLAVVALSLVVALFVGNLVGGQNRDQPATPQPTASEGEQQGRQLAEGERVPGMPEQPLDSYEAFEDSQPRNPDRQLDYDGNGEQLVEFKESLGSYEAYATQTINWSACGEGGTAVCAKVLAPLDWNDPAGPAIELAVTKVAAGGESRDALFVNPGGPGAEGQTMAHDLAGRWEGYDVIGWDPRGTGESTRVLCGTGPETDALLSLDESPDDEAEVAALREGAASFARSCRDSSGDLLDHLTTVEVVRDLDLLRHLVGAEKLNFLGISYGTYLGSTYAQLFPNSVGRMILDAAVEITNEDEVPQAAGFELAWDAFAQWCAGSDLCSLGDDAAQIEADVDAFLKGLDAKPLQVGERQLTQTLATTGIAVFLYDTDEAYRTLALVLEQAMAGVGDNLLLVADLYNSRDEQGNYGSLVYSFPALSCADWADTGAASAEERWRGTFAEAPFMAPNMGMTYNCQFWTADSAPFLKLTAEGAPPILVVGTTGDSATPYEQAVSMAEQLSSGVLLTLEGAGHGAVTGDNECIAAAVDKYLYEGEPPAEGTVCK